MAIAKKAAPAKAAPAKAAPAKEVKKEVKKAAPAAKNESSSTGDLENHIYESLELSTKKEAKLIVKAVVTGICELVKETGRLQIADFGILGVKTIGARTGRNPKTGEAMKLKATKTVSFKTSKAFKDYVRS
jgi:DNA-binding protein HU-beta